MHKVGRAQQIRDEKIMSRSISVHDYIYKRRKFHLLGVCVGIGQDRSGGYPDVFVVFLGMT